MGKDGKFENWVDTFSSFSHRTAEGGFPKRGTFSNTLQGNSFSQPEVHLPSGPFLAQPFVLSGLSLPGHPKTN